MFKLCSVVPTFGYKSLRISRFQPLDDDDDDDDDDGCTHRLAAGGSYPGWQFQLLGVKPLRGRCLKQHGVYIVVGQVFKRLDA